MDARIKSAHDERNGNRTMTPKPFDLSGKVAIVTGGNGGIGLGMARGLAEAGAAVAVVGRNEAKSIAAVAELEQSGGKAMSVIADVTDKAAVAAMAERVKRELGRIDILVNNAADNIQVNAVLPGWIDTDLTKRARLEIDGLHERVLARTPAARWGAIADFAGIAVFLSSPASDFVTGTAIPVDGGYSIMG